ncbi:MAG: zinc-dependent metalloprotease [Phycisphaeraceae bacterium]|nr:zinc-dependent metalloprotease [Phycisphaeraceae bacterium]
MKNRLRSVLVAAGMAAAIIVSAPPALAQGDFPTFDKVSEGYRKVVSTADGSSSLYTLWVRERDGQVLAELPRNYENRRFYITPTVAAGDREAGVDMLNTRMVYWKRFDKQLVLIAPNLSVKSTGDAESRAAVERVFTDTVILTTPIVSMGPGGGPVIDLDSVLVGQAQTFFGRFAAGANTRLATIKSAKAFPYNIEISFELPRSSGQLMTMHYSIGDPPKTRGFRPREADRRVGFFYTSYADRAITSGESQTKRYIKRWALEKRDASLAMSPPKEPIIYYIEHTTPVRYRRWVRDAILAWNRAFEQVGIVNAIEVRQQDAQSGAYMDLDPEDMRYSFIRWTNANIGYAIGPSNAHPDTGEIYNADIVMDEAFIGNFGRQLMRYAQAAAAMQGLDDEAIRWFDEHPEWDPRILLATPQERAEISAYRAMLAQGQEPETRPAMLAHTDAILGHGHESCDGRLCAAAFSQGMNIAGLRLALEAGLLPAPKEGESVLDGLPESFIGPLIKWVLMHEVGHTLGLMHNFRASSAFDYKDINSEGFRGAKPWSVSVMDYPPMNIVAPGSEMVQGDWGIIDIGSYDLWAIRWGYTATDREAEQIVRLNTDPAHIFMSDEGNNGPDPRVRTWDLGENSLDFADNQIHLVTAMRERIIDEIVKDGQPWQRAREAYSDSLLRQSQALGVASGWVGGVYISRAHKGDADAPDPVVPAPMDRQRRALRFLIDQGLRETAFGLTPELAAKLGSQQWWDEGGFGSQPDLPIHDQILGLQATTLSMLMNPTRLRRVLDNEARLPSDQDALTLVELMRTIRAEVWNGLDARGRTFTERDPLVSSFSRNLQFEHLSRLIDLATGRVRMPGAAGITLPSVARQELREIQSAIVPAMARGDLDAYTRAHLIDCAERIDRALSATFIRQN